MGGDLVGSVSPLKQTQREWFDFLMTQLGDVIDGIGSHVYWDYWDTAKLESRLTQMRAIMDAYPTDAQKPIYITEFGVRGHPPEATGFMLDDGSCLQASTINAFQVGWFDVLASRLGYGGLIKWDAYVAKYDNGTQDYSLIGGAKDGWPLRPAYRLTQLLTQATRAGWRTLRVDSVDDARLVTAFEGPAGELALVGLDRDGGQLTGPTSLTAGYLVGGLPPGTTFRLLLWNGAGDGTTVDGGTLTADRNGVLSVTAPLQAIFALTTAS
jgi:hypothetical protein